MTFTLRDGNTIPAIGFGTGTRWFKYGVSHVDEKLVDAVKCALEVGYTHIDAAEIYNVDVEVGRAVRESKVARSHVFITDKYHAGLLSYKRSERSVESDPRAALLASLKRMQLDYVDLYLLHTPYITKELHGFSLVEAWKYMELLVDEGLAKSIGVSNFSTTNIQEILDLSPKYLPAVNQIEYLAYLQNQTPGIVGFCQQNHILVQAYSPLGPLTKGSPGPLDPVLEKLRAKYHKTVAQVLLRWVLDTGVLPITTSSKPDRMREFLQVHDFTLEAEDVQEISSVGQQKHVRQYWHEFD